jgi:hypothetical protein
MNIIILLTLSIIRDSQFPKRQIERFYDDALYFEVSCLRLDPKFSGSNPAEDDGFLRAIKIRSTTSFGGK